jgi:hypothetical protein
MARDTPAGDAPTGRLYEEYRPAAIHEPAVSQAVSRQGGLGWELGATRQPLLHAVEFAAAPFDDNNVLAVHA